MATNTLKINPNLFGLPYQFPSTVDPRVKGISSVLGRKFAENIGSEAPICTFIPGVPSYLSNTTTNNKINSTTAFLTNNGNFTNFPLSSNDFNSMRLYDFKNAYADYMTYVNIMCRAGAIFLGLGDITINNTALKKYNWAKFRWNNTNDNNSYTISGSSTQKSGSTIDYDDCKDNTKNRNVTEGSISEVLQNNNFVQFYVDADVSASDSFGNSTGESMMKSTLDSGSSTMKELAFRSNSGLGEGFSSFVDSSAEALTSGIESVLGTSAFSNGMSRILNLANDTLQGNNIIMPDVYQSSSYTKSYSITIHLKTPYGNKLGYYLNIFVPLMHILGFTIPRQASANSYESPFIIKAYVDGVFSCNMGIVQGLSVSKTAESWSIEGLPSEVDVTLDIVDLYSGIQMSNSTSPLLFMNNSSLIEYLAVSCGLSLISPNIEKKYQLIANSFVSVLFDVPTNIKTRINESIISKLNSWLKLYN